MNIEFKIQVHQCCKQIALDKHTTIKSTLKDMQEAANNETKSTAGDKHETAKAMFQLEVEKLGVQLAESFKQIELLERIDTTISNKEIIVGSLVETTIGIFYIAIGLGKVIVNDTEIMVISANSPIGKQLLRLKKDDSLIFNSKEIEIKAVC